ncbi:MAG: DUF2752 domain-containing protein [Deltaproteobacteria bacterium]|nr:DUF2752 domain-containing protein [Deltaproteobacteria bacterium]MBW2255642.1 DUF2752 domain-containing protein [Deltaproteobacteria bacterium]
MERIEVFLGRIYELPLQHRLLQPALMALLGASAVLAALIVQPGPGEWSYLFGRQLGGPCGFQEVSGLACPSCGMTRSWLWLVRGDVWKAFTYNAAGALLLIGIAITGLLGAIRLATRDPAKFRIPFKLLSTVVIVWMVGPYLALWIARMFGLYPLP